MLRRCLGWLGCVFTCLLLLACRPVAANAATCYFATGNAAHQICWLDLSTYNPAPLSAVPLTFTLPDGSTLRATLTNTSLTNTPTIVPIPTFTGSPLGNTSYTGVAGKPDIYSGGTAPTTVSNVSILDASGTTLPTTTIAGADAETLDSGDGSALTANITWTTQGTNWSQLQIMNSVTTGSPTPICTLSGLGTALARCVPSSGGNNAAYILKTAVTPNQTFGMSTTSSALQGYAFGVVLSSLSLSKKVTSRIAAGDQFTVTIARGSTSVATATTSGTATTVTTPTVVTLPADTYTMSEAGSGTTALSQYASSYQCTNANASSTTVMPSGNGTSFTIAPGPDDSISCAFTNTALTLTNVPVSPTKSVAANASVTDVFTLTNTSAITGTFSGTALPTITTSAGATLTPTAYTYNGTTEPTLGDLVNAISSNPTPPGGSITVGLTYTTPATLGEKITLDVGADVTAGTGTSAVMTAIEVDTVGGITILKSGTTATSPGGFIGYKILISNTGSTASNNVVLSDPVPAGVTINGTPSCGTPTGGAVCGTVTVSGNTVTSTVATFPAGSSLTYTILATAGSALSYTNTATLTPVSGTAVSASLATAVAQTNGISKTVRNVTTGGTASTLDSALPGNQLEFGLTMLNTTGFAIHGVSLVDPLPAQTTYLSASCGTLPAGITACTITAPAVGSTGTVTLSYTGTLASGATLSALIEALVR